MFPIYELLGFMQNKVKADNRTFQQLSALKSNHSFSNIMSYLLGQIPPLNSK